MPIHNPFAAMTPTGATRLGDPPSPWFYESRSTSGDSDAADAEAQARRQARQERHQRNRNDKTAKEASKENKGAREREEAREPTSATSREDAVSSPGSGGLLNRMAMRVRPSFGNLWDSAKDHKGKRAEKDQDKK